MNLWLRLTWYLVTLWRRPSLDMPNGLSVLRFRAWPHDLDLSLHMNNGRYLTMMDLGRLDLMVRSGLIRAALRHKWTPVANTISVRFRREIRLFQRFRLETRILAWDDVHVVIEHAMVIESGPFVGHTAAHALFKGGLYDRRRKEYVAMPRLFQEVGVVASSPPVTGDVKAFLEADQAMKERTTMRS